MCSVPEALPSAPAGNAAARPPPLAPRRYVSLSIPEVFVYKIPPATSAAGHKAADWSKEHVWAGRLQVASRGKAVRARRAGLRQRRGVWGERGRRGRGWVCARARTQQSLVLTV